VRYYNIVLTPPSGSKAKARTWSSYPQGLSGPFDPGALNIEFDFLAAPHSTPAGDCSLSIEGVSMEDLLQADQFGSESGPYWTIQVSGGMGPGLPLDNPKQAGLLLSGEILQSFGNWQGTEMTLDFKIQAGSGSFNVPKPIVYNQKTKQPMADALANTFTTAFPGMKQRIKISPRWVQNHDEVGYYHSLDGLADAISDITDDMFPDIQGVKIALHNGVIHAYDGTETSSTPVQIDFLDLVGQPTWIAPGVMQLKMVLRSDLDLDSFIKMPAGMQNIPGFVQTAVASQPSSLTNKSLFQGIFKVGEIRHLGTFRSPDAAQWVTIANCVTLGAPS
jgi:hypothetical protein